ncbi:MAG: ABC transporter substrate-binding protein [Hyphomicrobiales bacterium]|nr:ABC transporter substrate-binding protein [Hyphomicrobiales bacterium]
MSLNNGFKLPRRKLLQGGAALAAAQIASPFVLTARAADTVKFGWDNPLTGVYAEPGKNELIGAQLAIAQINAKGGILGRQAELVVQDSTSGDAGVAVQVARKMIDQDKVNFLIGNVNSALAIGMAQVANEKSVLMMDPGGHSDTITGATCHWNVFRICNTTQTEANAIAPTLIKDYGKKWYYITPDYAFGHALEAGMVKACAALGGTRIGGDLTPLGTSDYSAYLIKAEAAKPDVLIFLTQGTDMINALKQAVQFGLDKKMNLAGAQQELEALEGLPPEARVGNWVMEWYYKQPNVPHVADFNKLVMAKSGKVPTARTWFGYAGIWSCALAANGAKSLDAVKMAKTLQGMHLPPEIALCPDGAFFRAGQNQLIANLYVGKALHTGKDGPDDLFDVTDVVKGTAVAGTLAETGCKMTWPA